MERLEQISRRPDANSSPKGKIQGVPPWLSETYNHEQEAPRNLGKRTRRVGLSESSSSASLNEHEQEAATILGKRTKRVGLSESSSSASLNEHEQEFPKILGKRTKRVDLSKSSSFASLKEQPDKWPKSPSKGSPEEKAHSKAKEMYHKIDEEARRHFELQEGLLSEKSRLADELEKKFVECDGQISPERQKELDKCKQENLKSLEELQKKKDAYKTFVKEQYNKLFAAYHAERLVKKQVFYDLITATTRFFHDSNINLGQGIENLVKDLMKCLLEGKI